MFEPPSQPAAGWYPDPHVPGHARWWDGRVWVERWNPPLGRSAAGDLPDIGAWIGRAARRARSVWPAALIVAVVTNAIPTLVALMAIGRLVDDVVITTDGDVLGWSGDLLPVVIVAVVVASVLYVIGTIAMQALMLHTTDADPGGTGQVVGSHGGRATDALRAAVRCFWRAVGWFLVLVVVALLAMIPFLLIAAVSPVLVVLLAFAAIPALIWLGVRLAFTLVAIIDAPGNPFRRSTEVVRDRWWPIFGRLLLMGLIVWGISLVVNLVSSPFTGSGGFGQTTFEVDTDGNLAGDFALADVFPTSVWAIVLTTVVGLIVNIASTIALAGTAELYRTRHPSG